MRIIEETKDYIIAYKPAGIATQTSKLGQKDLLSEAKNHLAATKQRIYVAVINRLDQPVEGLVLMAKNEKAAASLSKQLQDGMIEKYYLARVLGIPKDKGHLEDYMVRDGKTNLSKVVEKGTRDAKRAVLEYEVVNRKEKEALLKIHLITGRHHQIRLQMSHAGFPLLGDKKYGTNNSIEYSESLNIKNVCLKAVSLQFIDPASNKTVQYEIDED